MAESGWYDDPMNVGVQLRFFDGVGWTEQTQPYEGGDQELSEDPKVSGSYNPVVASPVVAYESVDEEYVEEEDEVADTQEKPKKIKKTKTPKPGKATKEAAIKSKTGKMQKTIIILLSGLVALAFAGTLMSKLNGTTGTPKPKPTISTSSPITPSASPTISNSPTPSTTPTVSTSPTPSASPTISASPTPSASPTVSNSPTPEPTPKVSKSPTPKPTPKLSKSPTPKPSSTAVLSSSRVKFAKFVDSACLVQSGNLNAAGSNYASALSTRSRATAAVMSSINAHYGVLGSSDQIEAQQNLLAPLQQMASIYTSQAASISGGNGSSIYANTLLAVAYDKHTVATSSKTLGLPNCYRAFTR